MCHCTDITNVFISNRDGCKVYPMFITVGNIFVLCSMKSRMQETMKIMNKREESDLYNKDITFT